MLSSRAVLSSVGVGDSTASPTAALLLSVLQESAGRLATIMFAYRFGTALEPECKMYRLLADILNDFAFILDCLSPVFPKAIRVVILSFSSILRALCGVAAGSAKASLSAHFAQWGNLGELNAKDSSQETVISLLGMLAGSVVVTYITTPMATWTTLIMLLAIHLETNRRAVRAVSMRTLSRQRATIVFHQLAQGIVPTPENVSRREKIFEQDGVLRNRSDEPLGHATFGASLTPLLVVASEQQNPTTGSMMLQESKLLHRLFAVFEDEEFIIWYPERPPQDMVLQNLQIVLKKDAAARDVLVAWWSALAFTMAGQRTPFPEGDAALNALRLAVKHTRALYTKYEGKLGELGWDLDAGAIETRSSLRIEIGAVD
nr:isoform 2 of protein root uvb sensitive 3 [Quercus suber]